MVAHNPLHRSGQAALPHPAPTLGGERQALVRIGVTDARWWQPAVDIATHTLPRQPVSLAAPPSGADGRGISRFPHAVLPYVLGVSDRAGSCRISRLRHDECGLPPFSKASASRSTRRSRGEAWISRLNTRPARSPVNASRPRLPATTHDSGPLRLAKPLTLETFILNTAPV